MRTMGVGVLGAGGIAGRWHLPAMQNSEGLAIRWLAGRTPRRLEMLRQRFGGRVTMDYQEVIDAPDVDAVIVATPHPRHVEWGLRVLEAGKHLLMQKPLCANRADCDAFFSAARKAKSTVMCLPHFGGEIHQARRLVDANKIGKISGAYCRTSHGGPELYYHDIRKLFDEPDDVDLWFFDARRASAGALFDMGVYAVAQIVAVLGPARRVTALTATLDKPTTLEDDAVLLLELERGGTAVAATSWCDGATTWTLHVHGVKGKLTTEGWPGGGPLVWHRAQHTEREDAPVISETVATSDADPGEAHAHWRACMETGATPPLSNARLACHVTDILLAGLESGRSRQPIDIAPRP